MGKFSELIRSFEPTVQEKALTCVYNITHAYIYDSHSKELQSLISEDLVQGVVNSLFDQSKRFQNFPHA
jgi:hypothetical protein